MRVSADPGERWWTASGRVEDERVAKCPEFYDPLLEGSPQSLAQRVVATWEMENVDLWPGATEAQISAFERRAGIQLPAAMKQLYRLTDGMRDGHDRHLFSLWSLEKIVAQGGIVRKTGKAEGIGFVDITFADGILGAQTYALRLVGSRAAPVIIQWTETKGEELATDFDEFLCAYLNNPEDIYLVEDSGLEDA